jgi:hypothetical protein
MKCNTTGQTVINIACRLQPINRTHMFARLGGEIIKTVPDYFVSIKVHLKVVEILLEIQIGQAYPRVQNSKQLASHFDHT